jgi:glyoxylase I family protein
MSPAIHVKGYPHKDADGRICIYAGKQTMFALWEDDESARHNKFRAYEVGLHHIAFAAASRAGVDELYEKLKADGTTILDSPREYPYFPGFYAVYFTDPDGMKLEFAYSPPR